MSLRLAQFAIPREPVTLPNGRDVPCHALSAGGYQVLRGLLGGDTPPSDTLLAHTVRAIIPDATDDERDALTPPQILALLAHAAGALDGIFASIADEVAAQGGDPAGNAPSPARRPRRRRARPLSTTTSSK